MELGISSLAFCVEYGTSGKYTDIYELLFDASKACLEFCEQNDVNTCELVIDPSDILHGAELNNYLEMVSCFKLQKQVHGPFVDMGLCSHNKLISEASIQAYIESARIADKLGAENMTIHPGVVNFLIKSINSLNQHRLIDAVSEILDNTRGLKPDICIENMPINAGILLKNKEIEEFFNNVNRPDLYMTYDTSHFWTCDGNVDRLWKNLHQRIKNIHIVDNFTKESDTHPALGEGKINFKEIFDIIRSFDYGGALIIELSQASALPKSIDFITKFT